VYIDHHPLSVDLPGVEVVHEVGSSASQLAYRHLGGTLPRLYSRVALYGAIGDYLDHTEWVEEALEAWDRRLVYFEAGVLMQVLERARKDHEFKRAVVDHLAGNSPPSAMERLMKLAGGQARVNEALVGWVARNVSLHGAVAVVVNPRGRWGSPPTWRGG
jgi:RecJ-like exonuclease